jgi:hypothetical protein
MPKSLAKVAEAIVAEQRMCRNFDSTVSGVLNFFIKVFRDENGCPNHSHFSACSISVLVTWFNLGGGVPKS